MCFYVIESRLLEPLPGLGEFYHVEDRIAFPFRFFMG